VLEALQALVVPLETEAIVISLVRPLSKVEAVVALCIQLEQQAEHTLVTAAVMAAILQVTPVIFYVLVRVVLEAIVATAETAELKELPLSQRAKMVQAVVAAVEVDLANMTEPVQEVVLASLAKVLVAVGERIPQLTETRVLEARAGATA
jgi:hypothetical protein